MAVGSQGSVQINQQSWVGGISEDKKTGTPYSFAYGECIDFRKAPSYISVLPEATKAPTPNGLAVEMTQDTSGNLYFVTKEGFLNKFTGTASTELGNLGEVSGFGMDYCVNTDYLIATGQNNVSRYGKITSGTPTFEAGYYAEQESTSPYLTMTIEKRYDVNNNGDYIPNPEFPRMNIDGSGTPAGSKTYTLKSSIPASNQNQDSTDSSIIQFNIMPLHSFDVYFTPASVSGKTADITLHLYDSANTEIATATVLASQIDGTTGKATFLFSGNDKRVEIDPDAQGMSQFYYIQLTSSQQYVVKTQTQDSLQGASFTYKAKRLLDTTNNLHPVVRYGQYIFIGNGNYISQWDISLGVEPSDTEWLQHRLQLGTQDEEVCGMSLNDEYLVISVEPRGNQNGTQQGRLYFWDMMSQGANFFIDLPQGVAKSLYTYENITYFVANSILYAYTGSKQIIAVRQLDGANTEFSGQQDSIELNPNMATIRRGIMLLGYPSKRSNHDIRQGIYSYGAISKNYQQSWGYNYELADAEETEETEIGFVKAFGDTLYYGGKIGTNNFIGVLDNTSKVAEKFKMESLVYDANAVYKDKQLLRYKITTKELPTGITIRPKYKIDDNEWTFCTAKGEAGDTEIYQEVNERFKELQFGFEGEANNATEPPIIKGMTVDVRQLAEERDI